MCAESQNARDDWIRELIAERDRVQGKRKLTENDPKVQFNFIGIFFQYIKNYYKDTHCGFVRSAGESRSGGF